MCISAGSDAAALIFCCGVGLSLIPADYDRIDVQSNAVDGLRLRGFCIEAVNTGAKAYKRPPKLFWLLQWPPSSQKRFGRWWTRQRQLRHGAMPSHIDQNVAYGQDCCKAETNSPVVGKGIDENIRIQITREDILD